jgi:glycosyltransferase involved in cell wall biosynthesis
MSEHRLAVVMCVYNGEATVREAIRSVLSQSFCDFEFIILDDGSTDATPAILAEEAAADQRVHVSRHDNIGLTRSLNRAIRETRSPLIARQDADDVSLPERFARQVAFLDAHREVNLLGTAHLERWNGKLYLRSTKVGDDLRNRIFLHNPFAHTSVMFRTDVFWSIGGYDETFSTSQDSELWMRFAKYGQVAALPEPLVARNVIRTSVSNSKKLLQCYNSLRARLKHPEHGILRALGASAYHLATSLLPQRIVDLKRRASGSSVSTDPHAPSW